MLDMETPWTKMRELKHDDLNMELPRDTNVAPLTERQTDGQSQLKPWSFSCTVTYALWVFWCLRCCCFTIWKMLRWWVFGCAHIGMPCSEEGVLQSFFMWSLSSPTRPTEDLFLIYPITWLLNITSESDNFNLAWRLKQLAWLNSCVTKTSCQHLENLFSFYI